MTSFDLTLYFYSNVIGHSVEYKLEQATQATVQYLLDSNVSEKEIKEMMTDYKEDVITPYNLPDSLWIVNLTRKENKSTGEFYEVQDNLIKRNEFYYHPCLMLRSAMPKFINGVEVVEPYYCEPKCRFTVNDLIDYFCCKMKIHKAYMNTKYSVNGIYRTMDIYRNALKTVNPLDIMLFSIDCAAVKGSYHFSTITAVS